MKTGNCTKKRLSRPGHAATIGLERQLYQACLWRWPSPLLLASLVAKQPSKTLVLMLRGVDRGISQWLQSKDVPAKDQRARKPLANGKSRRQVCVWQPGSPTLLLNGAQLCGKSPFLFFGLALFRHPRCAENHAENCQCHRLDRRGHKNSGGVGRFRDSYFSQTSCSPLP